MTKTFKKAVFVQTATKPENYPKMTTESGEIMVEVACAGRSNVGKSSLLNHLFGSKNLVKTSSVPGKTQHLNFFAVDGGLAFVDLPGYGYAKVPPKVKKAWGPMVQSYLSQRESLKLVLFLIDIRRTPNEDDLQFFEWVVANEKAMLLVLTKVDKVSKNDRKKNTDRILNAFPAENLHYIHYSSQKDIGKKQLTSLIREAILDETGKLYGA